MKNKLVSVLGIVGMAMLVGCGGGSDTTILPDPIVDNGTDTGNDTDTDPTPTYTAYPCEAPAISESERDAFLAGVNDMRSEPRDCGSSGIMPATTPLVWNDALYKAAYEHNVDMAEADYADHTGSGEASDWTAKYKS